MLQAKDIAVYWGIAAGECNGAVQWGSAVGVQCVRAGWFNFF